LASDKAWAMILEKILPVSVAIGAGTGAGAGALAGWSSLLVQVRVLEVLCPSHNSCARNPVPLKNVLFAKNP